MEKYREAKYVFLLDAAALKSHQRSAAPANRRQPAASTTRKLYLGQPSEERIPEKQMALAPVGGDSKRATNFQCEIVHCVSIHKHESGSSPARLRVKVLSGYMGCQHQSVAPLEKNKNYQRPRVLSECERVDGSGSLLWYFSPPCALLSRLFMFQGVSDDILPYPASWGRRPGDFILNNIPRSGCGVLQRTGMEPVEPRTKTCGRWMLLKICCLQRHEFRG